MKKLFFLAMLVSGLAQAQPEILFLTTTDFRLFWLGRSWADKVSALSLKESTLQWTGKPLVGGGHEGTINFISGSITTSAAGDITQGEFVLDMNTIKNTDMKPDDGGKDLEEHLKSEDFFAVAKYPHANFSILKIVAESKVGDQQQVKVTGLLTLKGITNQIIFPATIGQKGETANIKAEITIDRTKWDIIYNSKTFFSTMKDGLISDEIKIVLDLSFPGC
ncbi:MAG: YceI family protein [Cyclobacteriaceae bacterium]